MLNLKYLFNNNQISFVLLAIGIFVFRCLFSSWIIDQFRDDNIFVLRAFYYPQSKLYNSQESQPNIVVILINLERRLFIKSINPECIYEGNRYLASLESVHEGYSHAPCRLGLFRIVCQLPWRQEPPNNKIGISLRGSPTIKISLKPADSKFRQLIFCPGRMFLFEQWHLFLATMESNKLLGADLIIAHIQSIITELIPLLKIYENEGILQIRSSLRMPDNQKQNLLFNPNEETLWNNQLINFHECLYEFKKGRWGKKDLLNINIKNHFYSDIKHKCFKSSSELLLKIKIKMENFYKKGKGAGLMRGGAFSLFFIFFFHAGIFKKILSVYFFSGKFLFSAAFIGFPDWDDILISPSAIPFTKGLMDFSMANPQVAAFLPKRYPGQIEILEKLLSRSPTSPIEHLFLESIKFSIWPEDAEFISKIILRPQLVNSVDLHGVGQIIEGFIQSELPENIAFFVHARDFKNARMTAILPPALLLTRNTLLTLQKHNLSSFSSSPLLKKLPKKEKYLNLLNNCLKRKNIEGRVRTQKQSKCFNYAQCKPKIKLQIEDEECLNTDNLWEEIYLPNKHLRIFVLEESRLKIKKICQI
uniref:Glycosyltransferase family 92 protein n=1 Tax=Meloidogyne enterolobii TaxID=390850 RepID=A0A6V7UQS8_MELEN|nr:unnamed protein product [Meloidogyne enterolobii]